MKKIVKGNVVDVRSCDVFFGEVEIESGRIASIVRLGEVCRDANFILPGFVDSHVHIESSMVAPSFFSEMAVTHGTVGVVSDPHEIANVLGVAGVDFMIENAKEGALKFFFGVPSCVPATFFETSGAELDPDAVGRLLDREDIYFLAEMMNYPGVIGGDDRVISKIAHAKRVGKPVDGHIPGVVGDDLRKYASAGISTDHECFTIEEAREKIKLGMKVLIREGSAAKNFNSLHSLIKESPDSIMFCTDDCHPNDFVGGHINLVVKRALSLGYDLFSVLKIASINPIDHYKIPVGSLKVGDPADFIIVDDLSELTILETHINGNCVYRANDVSKVKPLPLKSLPNKFNRGKISRDDILVIAKSNTVRAINIIDGELVTTEISGQPVVKNGSLVSNTALDLLKIVVINRYNSTKPAVGFIKGMGLVEGAIATTIAHDSHNIICVGVSDDDIVSAVNTIISLNGGLCVFHRGRATTLELPIAGLMSSMDVAETAAQYAKLENVSREMGSRLKSPFMTLSFMALVVIPELKLSDRGLFSSKNFDFVDLYL